jgi:parvulin-like peptidyl-prolyl isomerase
MLKRLTPFLAFLALFSLVLTANRVLANVVILEEIIAKVNGDIISRSEYEQFVNEVRADLARRTEMSEEQRQQAFAEKDKHILRDLIDQKLLVQKAGDLGVNVEAQVLRQRDEIMRQYEIKTIEQFEQFVSEKFGMPVEDIMDQMRNSYLSQAVMGQEVQSRIVIPRSEIEQYYEEHKQEFVRSEGVRLLEILIATEGKPQEELPAIKKKAQDLLARAQKGEPFAELARRHSESQSAQNGGDIGIFRSGKLRKEIDEVVSNAKEGFITDLIEVPNGYLILKVAERYREGLALLEEVQDEIRNRLMMPKMQPAMRTYLTTLREEAYIELRPGYIDSAAVVGKDTSWSDPAKLAPVTTTKEEVLQKKKKRRLLWVIPLPGGGGDKDQDQDPSQPRSEPQETAAAAEDESE